MPFRSCRSKEGRYFITWPDSFHPGFRRGAIADKNNLRIPSRRVLLLCIYHYVYKKFLIRDVIIVSPPSSLPSKRNFFGCPSGLDRILRFFLRISSVILSSFHSCFPRFSSLLYKILSNHTHTLSLSLFVSQAKKKKVSSIQKLVLKHDDRLNVRQF